VSNDGGNVQPKWQEPRLYTGYLKDIQRFYAREPIIQVSVQLVLSVFTVAFFTFFAIRPTLGTITTLLKKIDDLKTTSTKLDAKIAQLSQAQQILAEVGSQLEELSHKAVPENPEVDRLSKEIEAIANENDVYITSLEFQASPLVGEKSSLVNTGQGAAKKQEERFVVFSFAIGGSQQGIIGFLEDLENLDRVVLLTKVGFSIPETTYRKVFPLAASGRATIYYLPPVATKENG